MNVDATVESHKAIGMPDAGPAIPVVGSDGKELASTDPGLKIGRLTPKLSCLLALLLIGSLGLILRLHHLGTRGIWFDETFSAMIARLRWSQFALTLWNREANMAFYYLILHFWEKLGSNPEFLRGLSVIFSVAALPLTYSLGARLFDRKTGLIAAWLLAINAYDVRYAQEARAYALVVFFSVLSTWLLVRNLQQQSSPSWDAFTIANVLLVYSHFYGGLLVIAQLVSLLFLPRAAVPWRAIGRSVLWFTLLVLPVPLVIRRIGSGPLNWIKKPDVHQVITFFTIMAGNGGRTLLALSALSLLIAGFRFSQTWRVKQSATERWAYALILSWLIVPVALTLIVSYVQPFFLARYFLFCLPALLLGVAAGITRLRPYFLGVALFLGVSAFALAGTAASYRTTLDNTDPDGDWRAASSYIFERARPGDGIFFFFSFGRVPFEYYRSQTSPASIWPEALYAPGGSELQWKHFVFFPLAEVLADTRPAPKRVWVVFNHDGTSQGAPNRASLMTVATFAKDRRKIAQKTFPGLTVMLFSGDRNEDPEDDPEVPLPVR
jgi:mannosyltransferase